MQHALGWNMPAVNRGMSRLHHGTVLEGFEPLAWQTSRPTQGSFGPLSRAFHAAEAFEGAARCGGDSLLRWRATELVRLAEPLGRYAPAYIKALVELANEVVAAG